MRLLTKDNEGKLIGCKIQYADVVNGIPLENGRFYNFPAVARFFTCDSDPEAIDIIYIVSNNMEYAENMIRNITVNGFLDVTRDSKFTFVNPNITNRQQLFTLSEQLHDENLCKR